MHALLMEELEPRLLLSADAAGLLALWATPEASALPDREGGSADIPNVTPELLFVDTSTPDYEQLVEDVLDHNRGRAFEVILLDPTQDGVKQIAQTLTGRHDVPAVHIVGHGTDGRILLGGGELSSERLAQSATDLATWGKALGPDADILLYGCDVAAGDTGRALVDGLARATGADVAASTDATGQPALGGDWDLEYHAGRVDTPIAFGMELRQDWMGVLMMHGSDPPYVVNNTGSTVSEGGTDTITGSELRYDDSGMMSWQINYTVTGGLAHGRLELSTNPGASITAFTQSDIDANRLRYVHDGSSGSNDSFTFDVADNFGNTTANQSFSITVTQVNDAPVVNNQSFGANENSSNGTIVGTVAATDQDGNPLTYSITAGNTNSAFAINAATGQITVNNASALDFETTPSFGLTVQVSDGSLTDTATVTINLNNVNDAPVVNNQSFGLDENSANGTVVGNVAATDADGNTLTYSITAGNTNNAFTINAATGQITVNNASQLDYETTASYALTVQVQDNGTGNLTDTATVTINLNNVNDAPVVNNQSFGLDENSANGTVVGSVAAADADGDALTYSITAGNTNNAFAIDANTGQITVNDTSQLDYETATSQSLTVQVRDNGTGNLTDTAAVTINLNDINEAPALNNQIFTLQQGSPNGTVVGTAIASDVDGDTLSYSITGGNLLGAFAINPATGQITVADSLVLILPFTYNLTVEVDDGALVDSATITITSTAAPNSAPVVSDQGFAVNENSANGTVVGTVAANDADGDTLTYSITAGNTNNAFTINASTGQITVNNTSALDFETAPSFTLTVQVQDNGTGSLTDTATVTIGLNDVNDAPAVNDQSFVLDEHSANGTVVGTVAANDADGDTLTYSITAGNTNNAFAIDPATGQITVNDVSALDFETTPSFGLTVQVSDGTLTDTATVTINLNDVNDAPVVNNQSFGVNENSANGTVVGSVAANDADGDALAYSITAGNTNNAFAIDANTGQITVNNAGALDFESAPSFVLSVQVSDGSLTDTATVTINLNDVNEAPVVNDQNFGVDENSANGTVVGNVVAADVDTDGDTLTYTITAGNTNNAFAIDPATGQITVNDASQIDYETTAGYALTVQVQDNDTGNLTDTATVTININDVNDAPVIGNLNLGINENSADGTVVGSVAAADADGDALTYMIAAGNDDNIFTIDPVTGQIAVNDPTHLDYEMATRHMLTIQVQDSGTGNLVATSTVTIDIGDIYEPAASVPPATDDIDLGIALTVLTGNDSDPSFTPASVSAPEAVPETPRTPEDTHLAAAPLLAEAAVFPGSHSPVAPAAPHAVRAESVSAAPVIETLDAETNTEEPPANAAPAQTQKIAADTVDRNALWHALDRMGDGIDDADAAVSPLVLGLARGVAWSLSAGFLAWILRAGSLLATALTSLPLWKWFDPLPVIALSRRERKDRERRLRAEEQAEILQDAHAVRVLDNEVERP